MITHITSKIFDFRYFKSNIPNLIKKIFPQFENDKLDDKFQGFVDELKEDIYVLVEYPYVDKAYRDSYYLHYASRHESFPRDSIRVSLFSSKITQDIYKADYNFSEITKEYLGFFIIRPTKASPLQSRSAISK